MLDCCWFVTRLFSKPADREQAYQYNVAYLRDVVSIA